MCCLVTLFALLGPRLGILLWWLLDMDRWAQTFTSFIFPLLGSIFLPWTTIIYVLVFPGGVTGVDWVWLVLAILVDLGSLSGGGYGNRSRIRR